MAGRRRGWFRSSRDSEWIEQARSRLAQAFLDMDRRQSAAEAAVHASDEVFPERGAGKAWAPVRALCYEASGQYLALTEELEAAQRDRVDPPHGRARVDTVTARLGEAARAVDEFYRGGQARWEEALAVRNTVPQFVAQVRAAAATVRGQAADSEYAGYPSVARRSGDVDEALLTVEAAALDGSIGELRRAAGRLEATTRELAEALALAPARAGEAATAIASVATRLDAVRHRRTRLAASYSALLREFNAASSADLTDNERESQRAVDAAAAALERARVASAENNPESARELTTSARGSLAQAEQQIDAVTERLALLREVREDPRAKAEAVRFRLRDAQMLAVSRGLVAEWGSVLDAQVDRIDRISETLSGRHPDYLAYVSELDAVTEFIAGVVDRMRRSPGPR